MVRVLIVSALPLLGEGLEVWLRQQRGVDVVGYEADAGMVGERIEQLKPEVVIVDSSMCAASPATALMRFLADRPGARIIGLDLQHNSIHIFGSENRSLDLATQFLEAIKGQAAAEGRAAQDGGLSSASYGAAGEGSAACCG